MLALASTLGRKSYSALASRKFFVGGNWKCNPQSLKEATSLLNSLNESKAMAATSTEVVVATPHVFLEHAKSMAGNSFEVSAQDCSLQGLGAFTGEIRYVANL